MFQRGFEPSDDSLGGDGGEVFARASEGLASRQIRESDESVCPFARDADHCEA